MKNDETQGVGACPETSNSNPVKAIRLKCLDCSGGSQTEVEKCTIPVCPLCPFRFGKNPFRAKRVLTEEQKMVMAERLAKAKASRHIQ